METKEKFRRGRPSRTFLTESPRERAPEEHRTCAMGAALSDKVLLLLALELASQTCKPDEAAAATTAALAHAIAPTSAQLLPQLCRLWH